MSSQEETPESVCLSASIHRSQARTQGGEGHLQARREPSAGAKPSGPSALGGQPGLWEELSAVCAARSCHAELTEAAGVFK